MADHADRLLAQIRAGVAELQRLERTGTNELELWCGGEELNLHVLADTSS